MKFPTKAFTLAIAFLASSAGASVVYTNLGAGDSYNSSSGWSVNSNFKVGSSFFPTSNSLLDSVDLAFLYASTSQSNTRSASVTLNADNGGIPGAVIDNLGNATAIAQFGTTGGLDSLVTVSSTLHPQLNTGTRYWIVLAGNTSSDDVWMTNTTGDTNRGADNGFNNGWIAPQANGAFRVNASVPEPTVLAPIVMGVMMLRRRRRI